MTESKVPTWFVFYLVAHPPVLLAAEVIWRGAGVVWQISNVLLLIYVSATAVRSPLNGLLTSILALATWAILASVLRVGFFGGGLLTDLQVAIRILAAALVFYVAWCYALSTPRSSVVVHGAIVGQFFALSSQALGRVITVDIEDPSYQMALTGVSTSVASFSAYLCSLFAILAFGASAVPSRAWLRVRAALVLILSLQTIVSLRRTAWLSMLALYAYWWVAGRNKVRNLIFAGLIGAVAIGVVIANFAELTQAIALRLVGSVVGGHIAAAGREKFFAIALDRLLNPQGTFEAIFGMGSSGVTSLMAGRFGMEIGAHSAPLDVALNFGAVGLALLLLVYLLMIAAVRRQPEPALRAMGISTVLVMTIFSLSSGVFFEVAMFPGFVALGLAVAQPSDVTRGAERHGTSA